MSKPFTAEQNQWLIDNFMKYQNYAELTAAYNDHFGTSHKWVKEGYSPIERRCRKMGLRRNKSEYGFTKAEDDWLMEYAPHYSNKWLSENITVVCGRRHTEEAVKVHIREWLNIRKGNGGVRKDTAQTYKKPIGSLCSWGTGRTRIKIRDTGDDKKDWYPYGRYLYEQYHNTKLSKDMQVIHIDGDKSNYSVENLMAVTHKEHAILTANGWHASGEITRTGAMWARLAILINNEGE